MSEILLRIGSLFTGTAALDMAVEEVFGGHTVWHCDNDPTAERLLAHRFPGVGNLGGITQVDWQTVAAEQPVDVLTGGPPCQDISCAGPRTGLLPDNRSGLWAHMRRAIYALQPRMVVIENVRGLCSSPAYRDVEPETNVLGNGGAEPVLRALGAVLGDLAELGFDAEWRGLPAAAIGAPHNRFRIFIYAWRRDTAADAASDGRHQGGAEPGGFQWGSDAALGGGTAALDGPLFRTPTAGRGAGWGDYAAAIARWEPILSRPAPAPTVTGDRGGQVLSPAFVEWMQGLPAGWVTAVPGLDKRNDQLRLLGNGVVPQQATAALIDMTTNVNQETRNL